MRNRYRTDGLGRGGSEGSGTGPNGDAPWSGGVAAHGRPGHDVITVVHKLRCHGSSTQAGHQDLG